MLNFVSEEEWEIRNCSTSCKLNLHLSFTLLILEELQAKSSANLLKSFRYTVSIFGISTATLNPLDPNPDKQSANVNTLSFISVNAL